MNKDSKAKTTGLRADIIWIALIALVYFIVARFSLSFMFKPEGIAAIWPLTGIFLSAVLLTRSDIRPYLIATLFFTDFIDEMLAGTPPGVSLAYSAALAGDATLGAWLMIRFFGENITFQKTRDIIGFLLLTVFLSNALTSIIAASAATVYLGTPFLSSWFWWFSSDGVGSLLVTPFIMSFAHSFKNKFKEFTSYQFIEGVVLFLFMAFMNDYAFSHFPGDNRFTILLTIFTFPFLIWASLRFGVLGAGTATIILAVIILHNTISGEFPQIGTGSNMDTIIFVQVYIAMMSLPSILLASLITERKRAEEMLKDSESRLKKSQEIAHLGSWVLDIPANRLIWSDEVYRIFGLKQAEFNPSYGAFLDVIHPEDRAMVDAAYSSSVREGQNSYDIEHRIVHKQTGEIRYLHERCEHIKDSSGAIIRSVGMVQDITERKRTEDEARLNSEIFKHVSEGIYIVGMEDGLIKHANSKFEQMFGYRQGEIIGKDVSIVNAPTEKSPQETKMDIMDILKKTGEWHGEVKNIRKDGTPFWSYANVSIFEHPQYGRVIVSIHTDITERKLKEETIRSSLEEKTILLNEIHHRVKNNLQIVSSLLSLQAMRTKNPEALNTLRETGDRIHSMALLHETLYKSGNMALVDFSSYIENICYHIINSYGAGYINLDLHLEKMTLDIDHAVPCGLIINELISNSLKHAFPGRRPGNITVELKALHDEKIMLTFADDGIGLPESVIISKPDNLGLKLVSMLTEQINGSVEIVRNKGTVFRIIFRAKYLK